MLPKSKIANAAGPRNNYVTLQRADDAAANADYEVLPTFTSIGSYWCSAKNTGGSEFVAAMQVHPEIGLFIQFPYDSVTSTITARDRIIYGDRIWNIVYVCNENENNEKINCGVKEPVNS